MRAIATALLIAIAPASVAAQDAQRPPRTITVSAEAMVEREPDRAVVMLAVESQAETAREAGAANAELMEQVIQAIRQAGIPDRRIRTTSYSLYPVYSQPNPRDPRQEQFEPQIIGYRAMNMVRVEVDDITRAGAIIDAALAAGANRVEGVQFELREGDAAYNEALGNAVRKARAQADAAAQAAGQTLGVPVMMNVGGGYMPSPPPAPMYRDVMMQESAQVTPMQPGVLQVRAHVTVSYELIGS